MPQLPSSPALGETPPFVRPPAQSDAASAPPILIVPGVSNSGPNHWQSHWERKLVTARRVEQSDWEQPNLGFWTGAVLEAVRETPGAILVAHSLGCAVVAHLARINGGKGIAGAMLVAPADVDRDVPKTELLRAFSPLPKEPFPFPSLVVASQTDPYVTIERAKVFAKAWGSDFVDLGNAGHINVDSGHHAWPKGLALLRHLQGRCVARTA